MSVDIKFTRRGFENTCCDLKAEPGKLDITKHTPGILFINLQVDSLFILAIMT